MHIGILPHIERREMEAEDVDRAAQRPQAPACQRVEPFSVSGASSVSRSAFSSPTAS
jgi:hypothetical protein